MRSLLNKYDKFEERILVASLAINVGVVFLQIIMRSVFNASISWSEELSRYIFIWQIWLGVSIAYRTNQHIRVEMIFEIFKSKRAHALIDKLVDVIWLTFNAFLTYQGVLLLLSMNARHALSSGMRLPLIYVYASLPVSCGILSLRILIDLIFGKPEEDGNQPSMICNTEEAN